jgi:CheY-like chemotaxis protein
MKSVRAPAVLLVEDHPTLLHVFQRVLEDAGYDVTPCDDGLQALSLVERDDMTIDLLLSDIGLPGMRGDRLAATLQRLRPELPVVLMTGYSEDVTPGCAGSRGVAAVLEKPISVEDLLSAVRDALESAHSRRRATNFTCSSADHLARIATPPPDR